MKTKQPAAERRPQRSILHVIAYQPRCTLQPIAHVDQAWAVADLSVSVRCEQKPARAYLAPGGTDVPHTYEDGYLTVSLPPLSVYAVVVVEATVWNSSLANKSAATRKMIDTDVAPAS